MLNPQNLQYGEEQYEAYKPAPRGAVERVQYDYRDYDGELFSCIKPTLDECRAERDRWLDTKNVNKLTRLLSDTEGQMVAALEKAIGKPIEQMVADLESELRKAGGQKGE